MADAEDGAAAVQRSRKEAVAAARVHGRKVASFEVHGRALTRNGRKLQPGSKLRLSQADAEVLIAGGRIKNAAAKAKAAGPDSDQ